MAREEGIKEWNEPLIIRDYIANRIFSIYLVVDRVNQIIRLEIHETSISKTASDVVTSATEIEVTIPIVRGADKSLLFYYAISYAAFVTQIRFSCEDKKLGLRLEFPEVQGSIENGRT